MNAHKWPSSLYRDPTQFWSLIVLSTAVYSIIPLGASGRSINLSLFDFIVAVLFVLVIRDRTLQLNWVVVTLTLGAVGISLVHSVTYFWWGTPIDLVGMLRETVKVTAFFLELLLLVIIIVAGKVRLPPPRTLAILFIVLTVQTIALHFTELNGPGSWYLPRNQHLATLAGIIVLGTFLFVTGKMSRRYVVVGLCTLMAVAFLLFNKTYLTVTVLMLALLPFVDNRMQYHLRMLIVALVVLLSVLFCTLFFSGEFLREFSVFERIDSIYASLGFRVQLWTVAVAATADSFPVGIGLGQFASQLAAETELVGQNLRFIHNTPLALLTELGFVGVILSGIIITFMIISTRRLPMPLRAIVWVCLGLPMFLHDALGLRMIVIVLATGMAGILRLDRS